MTGLISTVFPMTLEWSWPLQTMALQSSNYTFQIGMGTGRMLFWDLILYPDTWRTANISVPSSVDMPTASPVGC